MLRRVRKSRRSRPRRSPRKKHTKKTEKTNAAIREKRPKAKLKPRLKKVLKVKNARKNMLRLAPAGMKTNRKSADSAGRNGSENGEKREKWKGVRPKANG